MEFKASMEYKYKLAKLQYDKEKNEELIKRQRKRAGQVFPKQLEVEFGNSILNKHGTTLTNIFGRAYSSTLLSLC